MVKRLQLYYSDKIHAYMSDIELLGNDVCFHLLAKTAFDYVLFYCQLDQRQKRKIIFIIMYVCISQNTYADILAYRSLER